jgi:hypothetical protein
MSLAPGNAIFSGKFYWFASLISGIGVCGAVDKQIGKAE